MSEFIRKDNTMVVKLDSELDHHNAQEISRVLDEFIYAGKIKNIILDFEKTNFMDSSGIGVIIGRHRLLKNIEGVIGVTNVNKKIDRIMILSGVYKIVEKCSEV